MTIGDGGRSGPRNASQDEIRLPTYRLFVVLCVLRSGTSLWAYAVADFDYSYNNTREVLVCRSMSNYGASRSIFHCGASSEEPSERM